MSKILYVSDDIRLPTGYGRLGYKWCSYLRDQGHEVTILGSYLTPQPFRPTTFEGLTIWPSREYGSVAEVRYMLDNVKPDVVLVNADPRFFDPLFSIDNEIRRECPLVFYHLWDDEPFPRFNVPKYKCCDRIIAGSKFVYDMLSAEKDFHELPELDFVPIGIDEDVYKPLPFEERERFRKEFMHLTGNAFNPDFVVGFVGRFGGRKRLIDMMKYFAKFAKGKSDVLMLMHTTLQDEGGMIDYVKNSLFRDDPIIISALQNQKDSFINQLYNFFDVNLNLAFAEGFGMPLLEGLFAGTAGVSPANKGPLGFLNSENGVVMKSDVVTCSGAMGTPYIDAQYVNEQTVVNTLEDLYQNRRKLNEKSSNARASVLLRYNEKQMLEGIENSLKTAMENFKSTPNVMVTRIPDKMSEEFKPKMIKVVSN